MKKTVAVFVLSAILFVNGMAQITIPKIKIPTLKSPLPSSNSGNSSSGASNSGNSNSSSSGSGSSTSKPFPGAPTGNEDVNRTKNIEKHGQDELTRIESYFNNGQAHLESINIEDMMNSLTLLKNDIETLQHYYAEYTTKANDLIAGYNKYMNLTTIHKMNKSVVDFMKATQNSTDKNGIYYKQAPISYEKYTIEKTDFNKLANKPAIIQNYITTIDNYFNVFLPQQYAPGYLNYIKASPLSYAFTNESYWREHPEQTKDAVKRIDRFSINTLGAPATAPWVENISTQIKNQREKLANYLNSGEADKYAADRLFPPKAVLSDPAIEQLVRRDHDVQRYGTIVRVIISSNWGVHKNSLGVPIKKAIDVEVPVKKNGKCYLCQGYVFREYEGGGTYGELKLAYYVYVNEMNCNNVNKSK